MRLRLGDYVTAKLVGQEATRQGVFTRDFGDGTIEVTGEEVTGELETYHCCKDATIVPDENIFRPRTQEHVRRVRQTLNQ